MSFINAIPLLKSIYFNAHLSKSYARYKKRVYLGEGNGSELRDKTCHRTAMDT